MPKSRDDVVRLIKFRCPNDFEFNLTPITKIYVRPLGVLAKSFDLSPDFGGSSFSTGRAVEPYRTKNCGESRKFRVGVVGQISSYSRDLFAAALR